MSDDGPRRFATTRWTLILAAGQADSTSPAARDALSSLCETYWFPVYAFIRRTGRDGEDARDLTQAFFARVLEKNYFKDAKRERGRFRSFLLTSVRNFLANEYDRDVAQKRGGGQVHLSLEFDDGDQRYAREPADTLTPDEVYDRNWATAVLADAMARLDSSQSGDARRALFRHLKPFLTGDEPGSYAELSRNVGTTEGALRVAVHRLRQHFGTCLREAIAETVDNADDVDDELKHLLAVVSRQ